MGNLWYVQTPEGLLHKGSVSKAGALAYADRVRKGLARADLLTATSVPLKRPTDMQYRKYAQRT